MILTRLDRDWSLLLSDCWRLREDVQRNVEVFVIP